MNSRDQRILDDLSDHLREKVVTNISDFVSLCRSAELDRKAVMVEVLTMLIGMTTSLAADQFHISPAEFATAMGKHFAAVQRKQEDER